MRSLSALAVLFVLMAPAAARAAGLQVGVLTPNQKVRPMDAPKTSVSATLKAAKNEAEAFQIVLTSPGADTKGVSVRVSKPLTGAAGSIDASAITLYREAYYDVGTPSNLEGAAGLWPDPLVPDQDEIALEKRSAFPFDVPAAESRVVWVDILVPANANAGDYAGELTVEVNGAAAGTVPIALHVGTFSLPSTATLKSVFGMGWSAPCVAHTGDNYCNGMDDDAANILRARYVRQALEHRFTVSPIDFQPPTNAGDAPSFEKYLLPYIDGTGQSRLAGAKVTVVTLDGGMGELSAWIDYAKQKNFFDRLVYYPVDEPNTDASAWSNFVAEAAALHAVDANARILITSAIENAEGAGATDSVDVFVPVIDELEGRPGSGFEGDERSKYEAWRKAKPNREVWSYQSCDEHGCGACGEPSADPYYSGWPNRVIDSSAVQDRAFPWHAFRFDVTGELYFDSTNQLTTAWDANGQCAFSGSGDGTLFYPGKPSIIGGTTDIPVASIRMKMIREGMEDYEYLTQVAAIDPKKAKDIANALFPHTYESAKSPADLEAARDQLFAILDKPGSSSSSSSSTTSSGSTSSGAGGGATTGGDSATGDGGGCSCSTSRSSSAGGAALALIGVALLARRRRQR
jgi:MYXO-CTERM domain-containing protein